MHLIAIPAESSQLQQENPARCSRTRCDAESATYKAFVTFRWRRMTYRFLIGSTASERVPRENWPRYTAKVRLVEFRQLGEWLRSIFVWFSVHNRFLQESRRRASGLFRSVFGRARNGEHPKKKISVDGLVGASCTLDWIVPSVLNIREEYMQLVVTTHTGVFQRPWLLSLW